MTAQRILYIEDEPTNRILVKKLLTKAGFEVLEAEDGPQGLALAEHERPDLILLDMGLPDMSGYEVATRLRQLPGFAVTPVVALTGSVMEGERTRVLAAGCSGYLTKPIDVGCFVDQIREQMR